MNHLAPHSVPTDAHHGAAFAFLALLLLGSLSAAIPASAQDEVEELFGDFGAAAVVEDEEPTGAESGDAGSVEGQVFDGESGSPLADVTVILIWPTDGGEPRQEIASTSGSGDFAFFSVPAGSYELNFIKSGYRLSSMKGFAVKAGQASRADFPLPPIAAGTASDVLDLDAFAVDAAVVGDLLDTLELRLDSDQLLNLLSAEDLSRYAASDVADALKRVAGVNVVEGQFAIIRGLEDRYSSTLYNGAPIPSPDPDSQSVQLDLFPSDIVSNLVVAKTFGAELPSNSSGGSINVVTSEYPEELEIKVAAGGGFNDNAVERFQELRGGNPVGLELDGGDVVESDISGSIGGRHELLGRELRFKAVGAWEIDYETSEGFQEGRAPVPSTSSTRFEFFPTGTVDEDGEPEFELREVTSVTRSGGLAFGDLTQSDGRFDLTESERREQQTGYLGLGLDLDEAANHTVDMSVFFTRKEEEVVQTRENGFLPGLDYGTAVDLQLNDELVCLDPETDGLSGDCASAASPGSWLANSVRLAADRGVLGGSLLATSIQQNQTFERSRDLFVWQTNGEHDFEGIEGLDVFWAANHAQTKQDDLSNLARFFFEPDTPVRPTDPAVLAGRRAPTLDELGTGQWATLPTFRRAETEIDEKQSFGRLDAKYERRFFDAVDFEIGGGGWYEKASRDVEAFFLESPSVATGATAPNLVGNGLNFAFIGATPFEAGTAIFPNLNRGADGELTFTRRQSNESTREIGAAHVEWKATIWDDLDIVSGLRFESIQIESKNDPFIRDPETGQVLDPITGQPLSNNLGAPRTFPGLYILFDRLDNPVRGEVGGAVPADRVFNDQILGIDVPVDRTTTDCDPQDGPARGCVDLLTVDAIEGLVNGEIDDSFLLPAFALSYRPVEGLSLRGAYSRTVARPSFRELGFYVSVEPGSDDQTVGNPQLGLSKVESYDARAEYSWGDFGDLVAFSAFYKTIDDPIESIVVRDQFNALTDSSSLFRTFFNNPNQATLWGIELEARKNFDFLRRFDALDSDLFDYVSVGGNFTWIDASVDRTDLEVGRAADFFLLADDETRTASFERLAGSRRLFNQPEWIANADLSLDHPDWGTKFTLAVFGISDVLDAAGSAFLRANGDSLTFTPDRYVDSFFQLDLVLRQEIWEGLAFNFSAKNLTDSARRIVYDSAQTSRTFVERELRIGRDYSFSLTYSIAF